MPRLDEPFTLPSGLLLSNRIVKAAMTENLADADNQPTERHERLYGRWARGGSGLLVTGNLMVDRRYLERSRNVVADRHLDVRRLAAVRAAAAGTPMIAQLNHPGRQTNRFVAGRPVAPSAGDPVPMLGLFGRPRALDAAEVEQVVAGFGTAARLVEEAGLDGVQVHAAHGYLLAQFLSPRINRRTDGWGGDVAGRARALLAAVRAAREATGDGFSVSVKLNASDFRRGGFTQDDAEQVVRLLAEEGLDFLEISGGTYENPALFGIDVPAAEDGADGVPAGAKEAYFAAFATRARAAAPGLPVMLTGGIRTRAAMEALLDSGAVDLIGLARPLALAPELPRRLLDGGDGVVLPAYRLPRLLGLAGVAGESEWYETQLRRLGSGKDVDRGLRPLTAASGFVAGELVRGLSGRRRRSRLVAAL